MAFSRYFPSGEIAATATWPLFVRFSIENFSNGTCRVFSTSVYTPKMVAARRTTTPPMVRLVPNLCLLAVAIRTELLEGVGAGAALDLDGGTCVVAERTDPGEADATFPESISRCNRFKSARISAATW